MRDEFSKHRCLGQEFCRLLEDAEKTSKSFIPVSVVRRESVSHASRTVVFSRSRMRCCVERMCGCVCVFVYVWVLINYYYYYYYYYYLIIIIIIINTLIIFLS